MTTVFAAQLLFDRVIICLFFLVYVVVFYLGFFTRTSFHTATVCYHKKHEKQYPANSYTRILAVSTTQPRRTVSNGPPRVC